MGTLSTRRSKISIPVITIILLIAPWLSFGQFQVVHDVPNTTTVPVLHPLILEDGSVATYHWNAGEHIFRKYSDLGGHLWSRSLVAPQQTGFGANGVFALERDGANGFHFLRYAGRTSTPLDTGDWMVDYLIEEKYEFLHLNANGDPDVETELTRSYVQSYDGGPVANTPHVMDLARSPDGGVVLAITGKSSLREGITILKFTVEGTLEWVRSVGQPFPSSPLYPTPDPTRVYDTNIRGSVAIASDGNIYYTEGGTYITSHLRLAKLAPNGDLLWMKRYIYGNTVNNIQYHDIAVDANGAVHAVGYLQTTVGRFHIFMRISSDGVLERADIYRTPYLLGSPSSRINNEFHLDDQGRRYHRGANGILQADTLGSPSLFFRRDDQVVIPNNVFIPIKGIDVHNDRLAMSGLLHHEHVDLAFTTRYETLLNFDTDNLYSCFMSDTTFAHIEVPLSIINTEDVTTAVSLDVSSFYSSQPNTITLTTLPAEPIDTLCSFGYNLLGVEVGITESDMESVPTLVRNTLIPPGAPIFLNEVGAASVEVWSTNGALVHQIGINGSNPIIHTIGWTSGMYLVRALDRSGAPIRTERVMLE